MLQSDGRQASIDRIAKASRSVNSQFTQNFTLAASGRKDEKMKIERSELIELILNELHDMDIKSLRLVAAFIRGIKKRSRQVEE